MSRPLRTLLVVLALTAAPAASAAPCSGFTDVIDTDALCPSVDWLKNRAITTGCSSATLFCPTQPVIRLSMAAFMNRLGRALVAGQHGGALSGASVDLDAPPAVLCNAGFGADPSPLTRAARAVATVSAKINGSATYAVTLVQSTDGGVTWTPLNAVPVSVGGSDRFSTVRAVKGDIPVAPNSSPDFGVRIARVAGSSGTGGLTNVVCTVLAMLDQRTGTSFPF